VSAGGPTGPARLTLPGRYLEKEDEGGETVSGSPPKSHTQSVLTAGKNVDATSTVSDRRAEHLGLRQCAMVLATRTFPEQGLRRYSLGAYTPVLSIPSFTGVVGCLVLGWASGLDAFSPYPLQRGCPAVPCQTTGRLAAAKPCSSRTKGSFPSGTKTIPAQSNKPVSRRSKPISRSLLMGEQPHPWQLLHHQDRKRRHRSSKPPGRCELLLETTQLSPR
jgi:hypothetical protein